MPALPSLLRDLLSGIPLSAAIVSATHVFAILLVASLVAAILIYEKFARRRRTSEMRAAAHRLGLIFTEDGSHFLPLMEEFEIGQRGGSRQLRNVIQTDLHGTPVLIFDYQYVIGHGKHRRRFQQTVLHFHLEEQHLQRFILREEDLADWLKSLFGYEDIDFPDDPAFSRRYALLGQDEWEVRKLFHPALREWVYEYRRVYLESREHELLFFFEGQRTRGDDLEKLLALASDLLKLIKQADQSA